MHNLRTLVLTSARQYPERTALWVDRHDYSYYDLIRHGTGVANAIANDKRRTAILADRHFWSYAGIVGAVLAGHAYVPLNPRHPIDHLHDVLDRADIGALVIDTANLVRYRQLIEALNNPCSIVVPDANQLPDWSVGLDHRFITADGFWYDMPEPVIAPEDGAYLLFTSGSTGTPKGVMVSQRNVMTYLQTMIDHMGLTVEDRATQLFDLTFDLSVHDLFVTWGSGAALYCPSDTARMAPQQFVTRHALTAWFSTPSTVAFMNRLRLLQPDTMPSLRRSLFCGEALPARLAEQWMQAAWNSSVENLYGPTEATIAITAFRLPRDMTGMPDVVPIGVPLMGQEVAAFDHDGVRLADGMEGELCLSGSQVTEGYWRRPDLTDERFVWHGSQRWYHTGDRAVFEVSNWRFIGRMDRQVKISGHRVELQEVEVALRQAAGQDTVAALAWPVDTDGLVHGIVAVVTADSPPVAEMLTTCRDLLPAYMVPARVVQITNWPLNSNGKIDYRALLVQVEEHYHGGGA